MDAVPPFDSSSLPVEPTAEDRVAGERFAHLVALMRRLREPGGCPWDREQDFASLRRYTLEEAYEVVQAIDDGDRAALADELGDLLLQVVFLSQMAVEEGSFRVDDAIDAISSKLVRRHPHVFGDVVAEDPETVLRNWEAIKQQERGEGGPASLMDDVPRSLPALERAQKIGKRAAQMDFDWPDSTGVLTKLREEIEEIETAADPERAESELGDLLLAAASLARHLGVSAEVALNGASARFEQRFRRVEAGVRSGAVERTPEALDAAWNTAKAALAIDDRGESDADEIQHEERDCHK